MSKLIDLTGQKFYEWTVLSKAPADKSGHTMWNCKCSCGKLGVVSGYDLKNGNHKSCGHDRKHPYKDLTGMQFGDLKVLFRNEDATWKCICSCGKEINVKTHDLTSGHTKGCGHSRAFIDLTGMQFGEWKVLRYLDNSFWECQCSCGKISKVHSYSLRNGESLSCGHNPSSKLREDLTGKQFNEWTVLEYIGGRHSLWKCRCSCGNIGKVAAYDLKNGNSKNCGHNKKLPFDNLVGRQFGQITVLEYISKGMYKCQCSCGTVKNILGSNLKSGETIGCGCQQIKSKYTKEFMEAAITRYIIEHNDKPFIADIADELHITSYYVNQLLNKYDLKYRVNTRFGSVAERDIYNYMQSLVGEGNVRSKDRAALGNGQELDIYIPSKGIAIEYNGNFWHREYAVGNSYHIEKTKLAAKNNIRLIHIFEYEWSNIVLQDKLKSLIKNALANSDNVLQARNCSIKQVNKDDEIDFLNKYHLQGYVKSSIAYGLYNENNELVSIMSFGVPRFNNNYEWEIIRYCNKSDVGIIGGAEKLFKHFIEDNKPNSVISYCDASKFLGTTYRKLGFKATELTPPNYVWMHGEDVLTRYQTQKQKLLDNNLGIYGNTENEIMENLGYEKIYDCGNIKYIWKKQ